MGHPASIFLTPPDPNLHCAICLEVFDDPVSLLKCGHSYCRGCLEQSVFTVGPHCPECRAEIDFDDEDDEECSGGGNVIHSVRVIKSAVENSLVRCRNCLAGNNDDNCNNVSSSPCCAWTGPLSQWPLHSARDCAVMKLKCPIEGCGHACPRSKMKAHIGSAACVKAAVVSQVEAQVNVLLGSLKKSMKEEVERRVKKEKARMDVRVKREMDARLALLEANHGLRRENRGLKKQLSRQESRMEEDRAAQMAMAMERDGDSAAATGGQSKRKKKRSISVDVSPASSVDGVPADDGEGRKRKKNKKRRKSRQRVGGGQEQGSRMRSVSTDTTLHYTSPVL